MQWSVDARDDISLVFVDCSLVNIEIFCPPAPAPAPHLIFDVCSRAFFRTAAQHFESKKIDVISDSLRSIEN
jgi:hypothetical protein